MKKLINQWWFGVMIIILCLGFSHAMEARGETWLSLEAEPMIVMGTSGDNQSASQGYGAKVRLKTRFGDGDLRVEPYVWGSYDQRELRLYGQRAGALTLYGIGPGICAEITKNISLYGEIGYYFPDQSMKGRMTLADGAEGQYLYWASWINATGFFIPITEFEAFERRISGGFGGTVGADLHYNLGKHWTVGLDIGYRFLNLEEYRKAYLPGGGNIETKQQYNYGGPMFGIKGVYKF